MANILQVIIQGKDKASAQMGKVSQGVGKMTALAQKAKVAFMAMGAAMTAAAGKAIHDWAEAGNEVEKMARRTGFAAESLSELKHAAEISGTSLDSVEKAAKRMAKTIVDASEGMATYIRAFERIGLTAEDLMGLAPEKQFDKIAMAIARLEDPTLRAATAQDIFGRAGTQLLPLLDQGAEGIAVLRQEAHELGIVFDEEAAVKAANFTDAMQRMTDAVDGLKFALAEGLVPALEPAINMLTKWLKLEGLISEEQVTWTNIQKNYRKLIVEQAKAMRSEENQFKATLKTHIQLTESYLEMADIRKEDIAIQENWIERAKAILSQLGEQEIATREYTEALQKQKEAMAAAIDMSDARLEAITNEMAAELELAAAVEEAEERKRAARALTAGALIKQIIEGGGTPSRQRLWEYELMIQGFHPQPIVPGQPDIILDGEKVGELISQRLGETYSQREHLGG